MPDGSSASGPNDISFQGTGGTLYVGQLTGAPFVQGLASIHRAVPGRAPVVHCTGFKAIMDLASGPAVDLGKRIPASRR